MPGKRENTGRDVKTPSAAPGLFFCAVCDHWHEKRDELLELKGVCGWCYGGRGEDPAGPIGNIDPPGYVPPF
jgi:hypothetical protein